MLSVETINAPFKKLYTIHLTKEFKNTMTPRNRSYLLIAAAVILVIGFLTIDYKANGAGFKLPEFTAIQDEKTAEEVPINTLADINEALTDIVDETVPSVVTVRVSETVEVQRSPIPPFFQRFFGRRQLPDEPQERVRQGLGSGVIVSEEGYILTNNHVVANADQIIVTLYDGREFTGEVIGRDPLTDIAVVKINAEDLNPIPIGNSDEVQVGEMVLAIGSPLGSNLAHSVSFGIISAKGRTIGLTGFENFIQTDAAINPGNSGGALVNMSGQLIGINTAIASRTGGYQGIGFAVPSNLARSIMRSIIDDGEVERGYLGISLGGTVDATMSRALGIDLNYGIIIGNVTEGSPADEAGLQADDIIYAVNNEPLRDFATLRTIVGTSMPGEELRFSILRNGERMEIRVTLGNRAESPIAFEQNRQDQVDDLNEMLGFSVENLTARIAQQLGLENNQQGVVVTEVSRASDAYRQGLRRRDVITEVSNQPVENISEFVDIIREIEGENQVVLLQILRAGNRQFIAFEM